MTSSDARQVRKAALIDGRLWQFVVDGEGFDRLFRDHVLLVYALALLMLGYTKHGAANWRKNGCRLSILIEF